MFLLVILTVILILIVIMIMVVATTSISYSRKGPCTHMVIKIGSRVLPGWALWGQSIDYLGTWTLRVVLHKSNNSLPEISLPLSSSYNHPVAYPQTLVKSLGPLHYGFAMSASFQFQLVNSVFFRFLRSISLLGCMRVFTGFRGGACHSAEGPTQEVGFGPCCQGLGW